MSSMRNLLDRLPNGHQMFDRPTNGVSGAEILANTFLGVGDSAVGLLYDEVSDPSSVYYLRVTWCDIPSHQYEIRMDGAAQLQRYGTIRYTVYVNNVAN